MRRSVLHRIQRLIWLIGFFATLAILLVLGRVAGFQIPGLSFLSGQGFTLAAFNQPVALISGHAGYDSGAVCTGTNGETTLTEAEVNARIAQLVAQHLRRAGANVTVLDEYDERLTGLRARVLLSLHADSCIDASGYKVAHHSTSPIPELAGRLLDCTHEHYAAATGLANHPNTVTHNMTEYYAFNRIDGSTPAAILEMGFLGGDQYLLVHQPDRVARGIADSLLCFLAGPRSSPRSDPRVSPPRRRSPHPCSQNPWQPRGQIRLMDDPGRSISA
jgi:hypothetical protein